MAFGAREALAAAWLLAFPAGAAVASGDVQSEGLYLALFLAAVACLWRALERQSARSAAAAGALSGLAYLTRPEGLGVALVGAALLGLRALRGRLAPGRALALGLALVLGAAALALPYAGALSWESGELQLSRKKSVGWVIGAERSTGAGGLATGQAGMEAPKVRQPAARQPRAGREQPGAAPAARPETPHPAGAYDSLVAPPWTARAAPAALFDLLHDAQGALRLEMIPLVLLGVFALRGRPGPRAGFVAALIGAYGLLLLSLAMNVGYVSRRHALPPLLLLLGYGAAGALWLGAALGRIGAPEAPAGGRRARAGAALVLAAVAAICLAKTFHRRDTEDLAERRAAEWVRPQAEGGVVAARKRRVAYYAGASFVHLRPKTAASFERYFDDHAVRFVIVKETDVAEYVGLAALVGHRLEQRRRVEAEGEVALVYAYRPAPPQARAAGAD
jgi:hypothetical protein